MKYYQDLKKDTPELVEIIKNWKSYERNIVILSFAELQRRNFNFSDELLKEITSFSNANNASKIEILLNVLLKDHGCIDYENLRQKILGQYIEALDEKIIKTFPNSPIKTLIEKLRYYKIHDSKLYEVLKKHLDERETTDEEKKTY